MQKKAQKKLQYVYRIYTNFTDKYQGRLIIEVRPKDPNTNLYLKSDTTLFNWICSMAHEGSREWFGCTSESKHRNFQLLSLLRKLKKANLNHDTTIGQVRQLLHDNKIEHALSVTLPGQPYPLFDGWVTEKEIIAGKFKRPDPKAPEPAEGKRPRLKEFIIPEEQQEKLLQQIKELQNTIIYNYSED
jgi:hypothetical protein